MSRIGLTAYNALSPEYVGAVNYSFARQHERDFAAHGLRGFLHRNRSIYTALEAAKRITDAQNEGTMQAYLLFDREESETFVGSASLLPGLELLRVNNKKHSLVPNAAQKVFHLQRPALRLATNVNISIALPFRLAKDGANVGQDAVAEVTAEATSLYRGYVAWTLVPPDSPSELWYSTNGFGYRGTDRYDQREGQWGILPVRNLVARQLV